MTAPLDSLLADADLCVKCGLCSPHCPTYRQTSDENESPRGRIALIQGWAAGRLPLTAALREPLDDCLLCRNCEAVCPAKVPYGNLMDRFRAETGQRQKSLAARAMSSALRKALRSPALSSLGRRALDAAAQLPGGSAWKHLPPAGNPEDWYGDHPAAGESLSHVGLFLGCTAAVADAATVSAILELLPRLGVSVTVPKNQACCGAMDLHAGDAATAHGLMSRNIEAFAGQPLDAVIGFASGCSATLMEYRHPADTAGAESLSAKVQDIGRFLAERIPAERWALAPLRARILVHNPCSLRNVCKSEGKVEVLLGRIPEAEVITLPGKGRCCGAAGSYMIEHRRMAEAIRTETVEAILAAAPDYLVTSNIGCALHLRAGLQGRADIPVIHPVQLLARLQRV
ncbi:(Fe-S)-binding protein [Methylococcus geothermalis]|uniref:Glycolate oxidase iron-sulfur subunit n=1 Tax=Methylococcus geothermalis TaxID=2681310 RepID=A0A858Q931_9GAMM|nr:heterodisulfide reductase-related iron-sulfur binding cluster [Methylococcus geothermalis]QJD30340.1 4Fe-4S dicluster domain-containing protein [Methylococcus geothermalis]